MATNRTIILITGGNGGIGFELASQLLADSSKHVLLGSRSIEKGDTALKDLESRKLPGTVEVLQLDVASEQSVRAAAKLVESMHGRIDALVNNAGIGAIKGLVFSEQMAHCFQTNATGPAVMLEAFAPLLEKSRGAPRVINVSSGAGSITRRLDTTYAGYDLPLMQYRSSKAALNMITACQAVGYGKLGFKVFAYCPGFTQSNLGPMNNAEHGAKPTREGAAPMIKILEGERDEEHGCFVHVSGQHLW